MVKSFGEFEKLQKSAQGGQPAWLQAASNFAAKAFSEVGLPDRKSDEWKYTDLNFVNKFSGTLSKTDSQPKNAISFSNLKATEATLLQDLRTQINAWLKESAIENLNMALVSGGSFLRVPKNTKMSDSYSIQSHGWVSPRMVIFVEEGAELTLFEENLLGDGDLINSNIDVSLARNAKFRFVRLQNNNKHSNHISTMRVIQKADSSFEYMNFAFGSNVSRDNIYCQLTEPGTICDLKGLAVSGRGQHLDQFIFVDHASPQASSRQLFKNIVSNGARAVFNGKVVVRFGSSGTDAQQLNKNLLLGKSAEVDTRPQLEISNDDVKCSHGSTIGRLNPEELFYLQSRGISKKQSVDMLCRAFVDELVLKIEDLEVRNKVMNALSECFSAVETDHGN